MKSPWLRPVVSGIGLAVMLVLVPASPAWAHSVGGLSGSSNYRSTVLGVSPKVPGVVVRVLDDGGHIELINTTPIAVVILGYSGEPYLMVDATGVWENTRSPSLYLNQSSAPGLVYMPPGTDARAAPAWHRTCACDVAVWHDHRIHWSSSTPAPVVSKSPGRYHLLDTWHIYGSRAGQSITVSGLLAWVPGPSPLPWFGVAGGLALAVLAVGFLRPWRVPLATLVLLLGAVDVSRAAGLVWGRSGSFGTQLQALPYDGLFSLLFWLGALLVARSAWRGRSGAAFGAATISVILTLTGAVPTLSALWHSQVITAFPANVQRFLVVATLGIGVGLFVASWVLIERLQNRHVLRPTEPRQELPVEVER